MLDILKMMKIEIQKYPDSDDLFIELPPDVLKRLGWNTDTELQWIDNNDGSIMLKQHDPVEMTQVEIELSDRDFIKIAELAQKNDITFDQQVQQIMVEYIESFNDKLPGGE